MVASRVGEVKHTGVFFVGPHHSAGVAFYFSHVESVCAHKSVIVIDSPHNASGAFAIGHVMGTRFQPSIQKRYRLTHPLRFVEHPAARASRFR